MTKKNIAVAISPIIMLLLWVLPAFLYSNYGVGGCEQDALCNLLNNQLSRFLILFVILSWPILLVSIPALFLRKEIHDFWFKWMMCVYMPIACLWIFYLAYTTHGTGSNSFGGPNFDDLVVVAAIVAVSALFLILSFILILAKRGALNRRICSGAD